jgi:hypothetical protein
MSLITRLLGFGLCLVGAFVASYYQSLHSTSETIDSLVTSVTIDHVALGQTVVAQFGSYIQQNVAPVWALNLGIGIAMVVGGSVLVAFGDRRSKSAEDDASFGSRPFQ